MRVNFSRIFICSLVGKRFPGGDAMTAVLVSEAPDLKLVDSTTSVFPSHRPRETPIHCLIAAVTGELSFKGPIHPSWVLSMRTHPSPGELVDVTPRVHC